MEPSAPGRERRRTQSGLPARRETPSATATSARRWWSSPAGTFMMGSPPSEEGRRVREDSDWTPYICPARAWQASRRYRRQAVASGIPRLKSTSSSGDRTMVTSAAAWVTMVGGNSRRIPRICPVHFAHRRCVQRRQRMREPVLLGHAAPPLLPPSRARSRLSRNIARSVLDTVCSLCPRTEWGHSARHRSRPA